MLGPLPPGCQIKYIRHGAPRPCVRGSPPESQEVDLTTLLPMRKGVTTCATCTAPSIDKNEFVFLYKCLKFSIPALILSKNTSSHQAWNRMTPSVEVSSQHHHVALRYTLQEAAQLRPEVAALLSDWRGCMDRPHPLVPSNNIKIYSATIAAHLQ